MVLFFTSFRPQTAVSQKPIPGSCHFPIRSLCSPRKGDWVQCAV